jgi:type II secretory pathway component GspD/PulD (secretin)
MGRLEVARLATEAPSPVAAPAPATESEPAPFPNSPYRKKPHLPAVRFRVVAEAVPLGTLASALSRELGIGILVAPNLVDLRVSLALPEATAEEFFRLLHLHYDVAASSGTDPVVVLEDRLEVLQERYEVPELFVSVVSVKDLPVEDVAAVYCKLMAGERGSAYVIGDRLIVRGERNAHERLRALVRALQKRDAPAADADAETPP